MSHTAVDLQCPGGTGLVWGIAREDLNASLISWGPGQGVEEHADDERDVLMIAIAGSGTVVVDGREQALLAHHALVIEKGARRRITAGAHGLRYLSVRHRPRSQPTEDDAGLVGAADGEPVVGAP